MISVRGLAAARVERPAGRDALASLLRDTTGPVVPVGGGTRLGFGGALDAPSFTAIDLTGLDRVIDHAVDDLTITVEPGITLDRLARTLAEKGQWLPLDPPFAERATAGGLVATAAWGPLRPFGETPRRHLIGIAVMDGQGTLHRAGGRVVKNVAGYDMMKLHTGALGTLGIIVELSFRLCPLPEMEVVILGRSDDAAPIADLARAINRSDLDPSTFIVYDSATAAELHGDRRFTSPLGVAIGFLGFSEDVAWCAGELERMAKSAGVVIEYRVERDKAAAFRRLLSWDPGPDEVELQAHTLPAQTFELLHDLADALEIPGPGEKGVPPLVFFAHPTLGAVRVLAPAGARITAASIARARQAMGTRHADLLIEASPDRLAREAGVWGDAGPAQPIFSGLKKALDPERRFNPGRFAGGL